MPRIARTTAILTAFLSLVASGACRESATAPADVAVVGVVRPVATVEVTPSRFGLDVGGRYPLQVVLRAADSGVLTGRAITYSSNPEVATVDGNGVVTAVAVGSTVVSATSEGKIGYAAVTVDPPGTLVY